MPGMIDEKSYNTVTAIHPRSDARCSGELESESTGEPNPSHYLILPLRVLPQLPRSVRRPQVYQPRSSDENPAIVSICRISVFGTG
jgi:hypothetical protein